jgi:hypothetical protein
LIYDVLYRQLTKPSLSIQYAINLFILCANQPSASSQSAAFPVVVADSLETLAVALPDSFSVFLRTPVCYKLGVPSTIVQLIEKFGALGAKGLVHSNIGWSRGTVAKPNVAELKRAVLHEFDQRKQLFEQFVPSLPSPDRCHICHKAQSDSDLFVYPAVCYTTSVPSLIAQIGEAAGVELFASRQIFCCAHRVHYSCLEENRQGPHFRCPVCSSFRNTVVPAFSPDLREFRSPAAMDVSVALKDVLMEVLPRVRLADALALHIVVLDSRAANRPEVLDQEEVKILYRNLFLAMVLASQGRRVRPGTTPLSKIVGECVNNLACNPKAKMSFADLAAPVRGQGLTLYRQLALFGYFMLGMPQPPIVDWDQELEPATLTKLFGLRRAPHGPHGHLIPIPMPDDWIDLLRPPYNLDITAINEEKAVCMLQGEVISLTGFAGDDQLTISRYLHERLKTGPALILHITGVHATTLEIASLEFNQYLRLSPAWLDKMGMPDDGLEQGSLLSLNRSILAELFDDFLSGKFCGAVRDG